MNANEIALPDPRLHRIKQVSRIAKFVCYGVVIYSIGFFVFFAQGLFYRFSFTQGTLNILMVVAQIGCWGAYFKLKRSSHLKENIRLIPLVMLAQIFLWIGYWKLSLEAPYATPNEHHWNGLWICYQISMWVWYWKLARLFRFYERGQIFCAGAIRCIKILGLLCIIGWTLGSMEHFIHPMRLPQPTPLQVEVPNKIASLDASTNISQAGPLRAATLIKHSTTTYFIGFFSFDFGTGVNFGPFFIGIIILLVAWIMDEGRKIQEDQALTV